MRVVIRRRLARLEANRVELSGGRLAARASSMVQLFAIGCLGVCAWRWSFDLGLAPNFPVEAGLLARWQTWFGAGATLQISASLLARYARSWRRSEAGVQARLRSLSRRAA